MRTLAASRALAGARRRFPAARTTWLRRSALAVVLLFAIARVAVAAAACGPLPAGCAPDAPLMPAPHHDQRTVHSPDSSHDDPHDELCVSQALTSSPATGIAAHDGALDAAAARPIVALTVAVPSLVVARVRAEDEFLPPSPLALFSRMRL